MEANRCLQLSIKAILGFEFFGIEWANLRFRGKGTPPRADSLSRQKPHDH